MISLSHDDTIIIVFRNAGFPDDPAMHGIIAGLWSSLSGAGRFVSRLGSGILVDHIGFDNTAGIVTALQVITVQLEMSSGTTSSDGSGFGYPKFG